MFRRPHNALAIALVSLACWLWCAPVRADEGKKDGLGTVAVVIDSGSTDLFVESLVRTTVEDELGKRQFSVLAGAPVGGDTPSKILACSGAVSCTVEILKSIGSENVVFLSLRAEEHGESMSIKINARLLASDTGKVLARTMERCDECQAGDRLSGLSESIVSELVTQTQASQAAATDPNATTQDDGTKSDGSYVVPDVLRPQKNVVVTTTTPTETPPPAPSSSHLLMYVGIAAGASALATGTVLVLIDGPVIQDSVRQPDAFDTATAGYVALGTGVALLGASALWWSLSDDDDSAKLSVTPTDSGASVVWGGQF